VLPGSRLVDAQLGMLAALPVDDQHDLTGRLIDIDDDCGIRCNADTDSGARRTAIR
jgi:hypothetical protein